MSLPLEFVIAIPARRAATRLPDKPLRLLAGRPLIVHVIERAQASTATQIVVATDDAEIAGLARGAGALAVMTDSAHRSGSDRLAEVAHALEWLSDAIVVNLQGDEPLAPVSGIDAVVGALVASTAPMATLAIPIEDSAELFAPSVVKVVRNLRGEALMFSRAPLPWARDAWADGSRMLPGANLYLRHIGIYAYRAGFLKTLAQLAPTPLEQAESLEQLRALEHGYKIAVGIAPEPFPAGVDTPGDLERVERLMRARDA